MPAKARRQLEAEEAWDFANEPTDQFDDFLADRRARLAMADADADPADSLPRWPLALVEDCALSADPFKWEPMYGPSGTREPLNYSDPEAAPPPADDTPSSQAINLLIFDPQAFRERWLHILRRLGPLPFTRWKIMDYRNYATFKYIGPPDRWTPSFFTLTYDAVYDGTASGLFDRMGFAP